MTEKNVQKIDFDEFADDYEHLHANNVQSSGFSPDYFDEYKIREVARILSKEITLSTSRLSILNYGCGIGKSELYFQKYFPNSSSLGVDISSESIRRARELNQGRSGIEFSQFDPGTFPEWGKFDIIYIANVFHHIPYEFHKDIFSHLRTLLTTNGSLFIYEHNPWNPITVRTIKQCEFDKDAVLLSPAYCERVLKQSNFSKLNKRFTLFFPAFFKALIPLEQYMWFLPIGAQYYIRARQ